MSYATHRPGWSVRALRRAGAIAIAALVFAVPALSPADAGTARPVRVPDGARAAVPDATGALVAPGAGVAVAAGDRGQPIAPLAASSAATVQAGRSFTYQGLLRDSGLPLSASCDLQFSLWDDATGGAQLGSTQSVTTTLTSGLFTVLLNDANQFGTAGFDGRALWLAIAVRSPSGSGAYTALSPRQPITTAPIASALVPHANVSSTDSYSGDASANFLAPAAAWSNTLALSASAAPHSNYVGLTYSAGVWGDAGIGVGVWGSTNTGIAIRGDAYGAGYAGQFYGDVLLNGRLQSTRFRTTLVLNSVGPLPLTSGTFSTGGGTLLIAYSGSGYLPAAPAGPIGMSIKLDNTIFDQTAIYANFTFMHLAFVPKTWVLTGIPAGTHTVSLLPYGPVATDAGDIFNVSVTEFPF